jgi:class 3 adenylate cyclase/pSer/pThr/pTyr-binding forkhead associated (FHA) protein
MPYLIHGYQTSQQKIYQLVYGSNTIGRSGDNIVVLDYGTISRYHAVIDIDENDYKIQDLGSKNFTFVNQNQIEEATLKNGDLIRFGDECFVFSLSKEESENSQFPSGVSLPLNSQEKSQPLDSKSSSSEENIKQFPLQTRKLSVKDLCTSGSSSVLKIKQQNIYERKLDKLQVLLEVSTQLSSPQSLDKLLANILQVIFEIMNVDRGAILLLDEDKKELKCHAIKAKKSLKIKQNFYSKKIVKLAYKTGKAIVTSNAVEDTRFHDSTSILRQQIQASICIPLKPRDEVIGLLYLDNLDHWGYYPDEDIDFVTALANQIAIAIDNTRLYQKLESEAVKSAKLELFFPNSVRKKLQETDILEVIETEVTVLFADISGFTEMSSKLSPKEVIEILNEYFSVVIENIIFKYEGTLEKYIGDALLAVWGAPYQQQDDADRALKAAIEMQQAVQKLNKHWREKRDLEIAIHIGLNTGKVAAGNIGSEKLIQYATIGDTTNVSSRICNVAKADQILISQSTLEKINQSDYQITPIPPVMVKGKSEPLQLYLVDWTITV